jgi:starch synthase
VPDVPLDPLTPLVPDVPEVPLDPLTPLVPEVPDVPAEPAIPPLPVTAMASENVSPSLTKYIESSGKPFLPFQSKEVFADAYTHFYKNEVLKV